MTVWSDAIETVWPGRDGPDGLLPPLLLLLTVVTGLVDAASYLKLGHVFVANMTGNVVFLGFAIAGAGGLSIWASLVAIGSFLVGGLAGGRIGGRHAEQRGTLLRVALAAQLPAVAVAVALAATGGDPIDGARRYVLTAALALAMGVQNATARRLAVPELTTTVLTMTLTGIAADSTLAGGRGSKIGRRLVAVAAMFAGALIGALLALRVGTVAPLAAAAGVVALALVATHTFTNARAAWAR
ncbi:MAG TPA: YoaK family protein [Gaiellaceae bacterium]